MATGAPTHTALRVLLGILTVLVALGGLLALLATSWILHLSGMPGLFGGGAIGLLFKFLGVLALGLAYLLYHASRDPVRYVAVIDFIAFLLIVGAVIDVYAAATHSYGPFFPAGLIWGRAVFRLVIAAVLILWRPRSA